MAWRWLLVVVLSMVPALVAGPSAGILAAMHFGFAPEVYLPVVALASFVEGLAVVKLAELALRSPAIEHRLAPLRTERAVRWASKWGPWGGLLLGVATLGQEPILIALVWLKVERRKLVLPLALSSTLFTGIYFVTLRQGLASLSKLDELWRLLDTL